MNRKLLSLYGLKWNPFSPDIPTDALRVTAAVDHFCWRVEQQTNDGGFIAVVGDPGTGKSASLRILLHRLEQLREVTVGVLSRPQSSAADFYRELGHLFGVTLSPHNRWVGAKMLRETWLSHVDSSRSRPVLLIDEAQEMKPVVLAELRLLSSLHLDSRALLTVVLCGDHRLTAKFRSPDLLSIASRIRVRLNMDFAPVDELSACLTHALEQAGNPSLMTDTLIQTIAEHAAGNYRTMMTMADELLATGAQRELKQLDEKLYLDIYGLKTNQKRKPSPAAHQPASA